MQKLVDRCLARLLFAGLLFGCRSQPIDPVAPPAVVDVPSIEGVVLCRGEIPQPERFELDAAMSSVWGAEEYVDETWVVGSEGGIANCVVTAHRLDGDELAPEPSLNAVFAKVGPHYEPRVLVVTPGTRLTLRNVDSPCNGFMARPLRNPGFNMMFPAGQEKQVTIERPEAILVQCDLREYMRGAIVCVDTPHWAVTDASGRFALRDLDPGRYKVRVWHEAVPKPALPKPMSIALDRPVALEFVLR